MCLARSAASHAVAGDTAACAPVVATAVSSRSSAPVSAAPSQAAAAAWPGGDLLPVVASGRRRGAWVPLERLVVVDGSGDRSAARAARGVFALDASLLPAGVISVPMSRSERLLGGGCPYARTESILLVSAPASASPSSRAAAAGKATAPSAVLHECLPFCDADGSSIRSSAQELRRRSSSGAWDEESHRCASSHLDGLGFALT